MFGKPDSSFRVEGYCVWKPDPTVCYVTVRAVSDREQVPVTGRRVETPELVPAVNREPDNAILVDGDLDYALNAKTRRRTIFCNGASRCFASRSEEHTSELQSHSDLVCRLLLEKKK